MLTAVIILYVILMVVVFPIKFRALLFLSLNKGYLLANLTMYGLPSIKFKIETEEGLVITIGKKKSQLIKEQFIAIAQKVKIDMDTLRLFRLRGFYVRGIFGGDNAAVTALSCSTATLLLEFVDDWFHENPDRNSIYIAPDYDNARLELEINLVTVFSLSMIIFTFFRILKNRRDDKNVKRSK